MQDLVFVMLVACSSSPIAPAGAECNVAYGQPMIDCVVNALNEAMGCTQYVEDGPARLKNVVNGGTVVEIEFVDHEIESSDAGIAIPVTPDTWHVQVTTASPWPWVVAGTLMHELGHTLFMSFPNNPSDPVHSLAEGSIMHASSTQVINTASKAGFAAEMRAASSDSAKCACK